MEPPPSCRKPTGRLSTTSQAFPLRRNSEVCAR